MLLKLTIKYSEKISMVTFFSIFFLWDYHPYGLDFRILVFAPVLLAFYTQGWTQVRAVPVSGYAIFIFICLHLFVVTTLYGFTITVREIKSIVLLIAIMFFVASWGLRFRDWLADAFRLLIWVTFLTQIAEYAGILDYSSHAEIANGFIRRSGIFSEPSHLGLTFAAMWAVIFNRFSYWKAHIGLVGIVVAAISSLMAFSVTLVAGFMIFLMLKILIIGVKEKRVRFIAVNFCLFAVVGGALFQISYVKDRIYPIMNIVVSPSQIIIKPSENLSAAVLLNSIKVTSKSLQEYPLGVGFNMYQVSHHTFSQGAYALQSRIMNPSMKPNMRLSKLCEYDAGSNLMKSITEYGFFAVFIFIAALISLFIFYKKEREFNIFALTLIFISFVRGVGYFNGGVLAVCFYLLFYGYDDDKKT